MFIMALLVLVLFQFMAILSSVHSAETASIIDFGDVLSVQGLKNLTQFRVFLPNTTEELQVDILKPATDMQFLVHYHSVDQAPIVDGNGGPRTVPVFYFDVELVTSQPALTVSQLKFNAVFRYKYDPSTLPCSDASHLTFLVHRSGRWRVLEEPTTIEPLTHYITQPMSSYEELNRYENTTQFAVMCGDVVPVSDSDDYELYDRLDTVLTAVASNSTLEQDPFENQFQFQLGGYESLQIDILGTKNAFEWKVSKLEQNPTTSSQFQSGNITLHYFSLEMMGLNGSTIAPTFNAVLRYKYRLNLIPSQAQIDSIHFEWFSVNQNRWVKFTQAGSINTESRTVSQGGSTGDELKRSPTYLVIVAKVKEPQTPSPSPSPKPSTPSPSPKPSDSNVVNPPPSSSSSNNGNPGSETSTKPNPSSSKSGTEPKASSSTNSSNTLNKTSHMTGITCAIIALFSLLVLSL